MCVEPWPFSKAPIDWSDEKFFFFKYSSLSSSAGGVGFSKVLGLQVSDTNLS